MRRIQRTTLRQRFRRWRWTRRAMGRIMAENDRYLTELDAEITRLRAWTPPT